LYLLSIFSKRLPSFTANFSIKFRSILYRYTSSISLSRFFTTHTTKISAAIVFFLIVRKILSPSELLHLFYQPLTAAPTITSCTSFAVFAISLLFAVASRTCTTSALTFIWFLTFPTGFGTFATCLFGNLFLMVLYLPYKTPFSLIKETYRQKTQ
jgi:hypothetical protein